MIKYVCDRCGKEHRNANDLNKIDLTIRDITGGITDETSFDLCNACSHAVLMLIQKGVEQRA